MKMSIFKSFYSLLSKIIILFFIAAIACFIFYLTIEIPRIKKLIYKTEKSAISPELNNLVLINYADGDVRYFINQEILNLSANFHNINTIYPYHHKDLNEEFVKKHAKILNQKRGSGYWLWKPYIILDAMNKTKDGTIIFYMDADTIIQKDLSPLIKIAEKNNIVLFESFLTNRPYIKRDLYIAMKADNENYYDKKQIGASYIMLKNNESNRKFIEKWLEYCTNENNLTDIPSVYGSEIPGFIEHRHEQAILTLLVQKEYKAFLISEEERKEYIANHGANFIFSPLRSFIIWYEYIHMIKQLNLQN